ncbi:hypothetical protein HDV57DRAFT_196064 [Trichoderma longibrachiatum]|uniref:Uncharacterized protein n=1 Tax=Trichoderma longibrachiatum ATCC 18648 TaxID=983965 RepID=A0A2T4C8K0_TRILO|nr:hypothetical protein M440DRAFT_1227307 [Trichoderma longibrachiatum ATCC 18648]
MEKGCTKQSGRQASSFLPPWGIPGPESDTGLALRRTIQVGTHFFLFFLFFYSFLFPIFLLGIYKALLILYSLTHLPLNWFFFVFLALISAWNFFSIVEVLLLLVSDFPLLLISTSPPFCVFICPSDTYKNLRILGWLIWGSFLFLRCLPFACNDLEQERQKEDVTLPFSTYLRLQAFVGSVQECCET